MSTEISTVQPRGLALATFEDAFRFSKLVATSDFAPKDFRGKPESCLLAIQHGAEVGPVANAVAACALPWSTAGRASTATRPCRRLQRRLPVCEWVRETIERRRRAHGCNMSARLSVVVTLSRSKVRFSVADAKKAGLWGKGGPWTQYPRRMLQMRARGFALRDAFPDVLRGLVTAEEAADYTHVETEPVRVTQPTPPPCG
jgi:hypothetical protein